MTDIPSGCELRCPGCRDRGLTYQDSLERKERSVRATLSAWEDRIEEIRGCGGDGWRYRGSLFLRAWRDEQAWALGLLRRQGREEERIAIPGCPVHRPGINSALGKVRGLLSSASDLPWFGALVRGSLLTLVLKEKTNVSRVEALRTLAWSETGFSGVFLNFNPSAGDRILFSKGWVHLWGDPEALLDGPVPQAHGPSSFSQQIPELHWHSIQMARDFFQSRTEALGGILDLYSGVGITLREWRDSGFETIGVELGREAVHFARRSGVILEGRVKDRLPQLMEWVQSRAPWGAYVNPSRLGIEAEVSEWLARSPACQRIAYLSCNPLTLKRDLELLERGGFRVQKVMPYDFLPRSGHVEALVLIDRG